jgi:hypothetical protein
MRAGRQFDQTIRVIHLRGVDTGSRREFQAAGPREWSCRWLVRGHWRQQWCPGRREHRPIWITPYVRGPGDKPFKAPSAKVFAVVR